MTLLAVLQVELKPEDSVRLHQLLSMPNLIFVRLCNTKQLAAVMAAGSSSDTARLSIPDLCFDGNMLTSSQLPHVQSWFDLAVRDTLDLRYNSLLHLPKVSSTPALTLTHSPVHNMSCMAALHGCC